MDPITIILSAAVIGLAAGLKPTAETAVKDAYTGLKQVIIDHYRDYRGMVRALDALEEDPGDKDQQELLKNKLTEAGAAQNADLIKAAEHVHAVAKAQDSAAYQTAIGFYMGTLEAKELEVKDVRTGGEGVDTWVEKAKIEGKATFSGIGKPKADPN